VEDKILQRAVVMLLEPSDEREFFDCSDGFRPGRSAHQALQALWQGLGWTQSGWVVDVDIRAFFDTLDHGQLMAILQKRVKDGVILKLVAKWLKAGVLEQGALTYPETGTPQGGVISPLLSNIYLHEVLDEWFEATVRPRLKGPGFMVRGVAARSKALGQRLHHPLGVRSAREAHDEVVRILRARRGSCASGNRRPGARQAAAETNLKRSTSWASPSTGRSRARGAGSSSARRRASA